MARTCKVHNPIDICKEEPINEVSNSGDIYTNPNISQTDVHLLISDGRGIIREGVGKDTEKYFETLLETITVKIRTNEGDKEIQIRVNKYLVSEIKNIFKEIYEKTGFIFTKQSCNKTYYLNDYICAYRVSNVSGSNSSHCYGMALDFNHNHNPQAKGRSNSCEVSTCNGKIGDDNLHIRTVKHPVVQIFYKYKWGWGGIWDTPDYMHFSKDGD